MFSCLSQDEKNELLMLLEKVNADWHVRYQGSEDLARNHEHHHKNHGHHEKASHNKGE